MSGYAMESLHAQIAARDEAIERVAEILRYYEHERQINLRHGLGEGSVSLGDVIGRLSRAVGSHARLTRGTG